MKLLTFRRLKMKPAAESKNFAPPSKNKMNTDEQATDRPATETKDLTACASTWGTCKRVYIYVGPLVTVGGAYRD
jgi:hypothetical protein